MFKNMSIKARLIFILCFLSALLLGIGSIGLYGISQTEEGLKTVYEDRGPSPTALHKQARLKHKAAPTSVGQATRLAISGGVNEEWEAF